MKPLFLLLLVFLGCQPLRLPPDLEFESIARGERGLTDLYFGIRDFHNARFPGDPFERVARTAIERRHPPEPQASEAAIEQWTVESVSHRRYLYRLDVNVTREARRETVVAYRILDVHGSPVPEPPFRP